jgi:hypothetical protein
MDAQYVTWYLEITDAGTPYLYKLKSMTSREIASHTSTSKIIPQSDPFLKDWEGFVSNENTLPSLEKLIEKITAIYATIQPICRLLFPMWVMDRFKEALDQYTRGEWLSSISLCGDIVEFIVSEFWDVPAYIQEIPSGMRKKSNKVRRSLQTLKEYHVIEEEDFGRLDCVRTMRDDHVHEFSHKRLRHDYVERLESDNIKALRTLAEFFSDTNIRTKYNEYLQFARQRSGQTNIG